MNSVSYKDGVGRLAWPVVVTVFVVLMVLTGGISLPSRGVLAFHSAISIVVLAWALWRLVIHGFPTRISVFGTVLLAASIALLLLQLIPLPTSLWQMFPGRELVTRNYALIGETPRWAPLSLAPENTAADGLAMLPGIAVFLATLTVAPRHIFWLCVCLVGCAIIGVCLSLLQHFHGTDKSYYLYDPAAGFGVGTFNNRNFFAAQLYTSIPVLSAFAVAAKDRWRLNAMVVVVAAIVYSGIILVGLSLSGSRTGLLLAMPAILFAVILGYSRSAGQHRLSAGAFGVGALLLGFLVVGQASMVGLLRLVEIDPLTDYRVVISKASKELAFSLFPVGGGFGTFVPLYQLHETPETMRPEFVNHAHNDWLELIIEGGAPAVPILTLFVLWLLVAEFRVWRYGQGGQTALFQRMASLVLPLLLFHSFVDYPLRTPAMMVLFSLCCGVMTLQPEILKISESRRAKNQRSTAPVRPTAQGKRKPFRRPQTGFGASGSTNPRVFDEDSLQ